MATTVNQRELAALVLDADRHPPGHFSLADATRRLSAGTCFEWTMQELRAALNHRKFTVLTGIYQEEQSAGFCWKAISLDDLEDRRDHLCAAQRETISPINLYECIVSIEAIADIETECNAFYKRKGRLEKFPHQFHFALLSMPSLPPITNRRDALHRVKDKSDDLIDPQLPIHGHYNDVQQLEARILWLMGDFYTRRADWSPIRPDVKKNELELKVWMQLKKDGTLSRDGQTIRNHMITKLANSWKAASFTRSI